MIWRLGENMRKKEIMEKLASDLDSHTNYTYIVLDLREYPHKDNLFVGFTEEDK